MVIQNKGDLCAVRPLRRLNLHVVENDVCFVLNPQQRIELNLCSGWW